MLDSPTRSPRQPPGLNGRGQALATLAALALGGAALLGCASEGGGAAAQGRDDSGQPALDAVSAAGTQDTGSEETPADAGSTDLSVDAAGREELADSSLTELAQDDSSIAPNGLPPIDRRTYRQTAQATFALG